MKYYFINTDAKSLGNVSPHEKWLKYGSAFTGGPRKYGDELGRLAPGDICLMYANKIGIVAVGRVIEPWGGSENSPPLVYTSPYEDKEYRLRVDWCLDLCESPITPSELRVAIGWNPPRAIQPIVRDVQKISQLIKKRQKQQER